jgi:hypothetical protein
MKKKIVESHTRKRITDNILDRILKVLHHEAYEEYLDGYRIEVTPKGTIIINTDPVDLCITIERVYNDGRQD